MASNAKSTQAVACSAKFTNEDYFAAVKSDNAHRYPGVRCGLTSLSELRKQYPKGSTCDMSEFTLPTVEENGFTHKPYNPDLIHEPTEHILNGERTTQDHRQVMAHVGLSDGKGLILAGGKVSRAAGVTAKKRRRELAHAVREYLEEHCADMIALEQLARIHGVSPFHLSRTVSHEFGISVSDMLTTMRMDRAKEMLRRKELSVKEIAGRVGYSNGNYFSKVFRRVCGLSPSEYRVLASRK